MSSLNPVGDTFRSHIDQSFWQMLQARIALDGSGNLSQFVQFNVALFVDLFTFLFVGTIGFSLFGWYPTVSLSGTSVILPMISSSLEIACWAIPSILRSTSNSGFFLVSGSKPFRTGFPMPAEVGPSSVSDCCCDCQALLSTIFGAGRGVESLSNKNRCSFLRDHPLNAICWHRAAHNYGVRFRLPKL